MLGKAIRRWILSWRVSEKASFLLFLVIVCHMGIALMNCYQMIFVGRFVLGFHKHDFLISYR